MCGRILVLIAVLGVVWVHKLSYLPSYKLLIICGAFLIVLSLFIFRFFSGNKLIRCVLLILISFYTAYAYTSMWAKHRLADELAAINVDKVSKVLLRVYGLPKIQIDKVSFFAQVISSHPPGVPSFIRVTWADGKWRSPYAEVKPANPPLPDIHAGQIWQMSLVLKPVSSSQNQNLFDYEAYSFAAGVRAQGTVRGQPKFIKTDYWHDLPVIANRARHLIRVSMNPYLQDLRYGPVLRALAIGDQDGVADEDWLVFNRSGLTHLVSISGSHITMLSGAFALFVYFIWCKFKWRRRILAERWPAKRAAACAAMLVAWIYCLLAGWEVPAQRTFMMLAVVAIAQFLQLRISGSRVLAIAAIIVLAFDPWAVLASGFWLSFMAVAVLLAVGAANYNYLGEKPWLNNLKLAAHLQLAVTFALAPALAWIFHEVSLVSPFANAYAIPVIELIVTPLSLLLAAVSLIPGLEFLAKIIASLAHSTLDLIMVPTEWLASLPTIVIPSGPAWIYLLASMGIAICLWPIKYTDTGYYQKLINKRHWAVLAVMPMFFWQPDRPKQGQWDLYGLDIGQGSAIFIRTTNHTFLFDTGARHTRDSDQGKRTILPFLQSLGINKIDVLIASHVDLDHTGGVRSVLKDVDVTQTYSSFDLVAWLKKETKKLDQSEHYLPLLASYCVYGVFWQIDGVSFEFLWPLDIKPKRSKQEANSSSCVLRIRGKYHSALLTGDIDLAAEAALVDRGLAAVDFVVAAHHGSKTSSGTAFVNATAASHVLMQVGRWNRHSHPHDTVLQNWSAVNASIWRTDIHGGVNAMSRQSGLKVYSIINQSRRYWYGR